MSIQCCTECDFKGEVDVIEVLPGEPEWTCPDQDCMAVNPVETDTPYQAHLRRVSALLSTLD
jgi:hypothetical protein